MDISYLTDLLQSLLQAPLLHANEPVSIPTETIDPSLLSPYTIPDPEELAKAHPVWKFFKPVLIVLSSAASVVMLIGTVMWWFIYSGLGAKAFTILLSNIMVFTKMTSNNKVIQEYANGERMVIPPRALTLEEFKSTSGLRSAFIRSVRKVINNHRGSTFEPYALTQQVEREFFSPFFQGLKTRMKEASRQWDECEQIIQGHLNSMEEEIATDETTKGLKAKVTKLEEEVAKAEQEHGRVAANLSAHCGWRDFLTFRSDFWITYFDLKAAVRPAWRNLRKKRRELKRTQRELTRAMAPIVRYYNKEASHDLSRLDIIQRQRLIHLIENFRADSDSIDLTAEIGRTARKLMDGSEEGLRALKLLKLEEFFADIHETDQNSKREHLRRKLRDAVGKDHPFPPKADLEDYLEAFLRKHLRAHASNPELADLEITPAWIDSLLPPGSIGIAHHRSRQTVAVQLPIVVE